jgi:hypothetical protein
MSNKAKLITALNAVVMALESQTIHYDWAQQSSCNCGVVAQAILGVDAIALSKLREPMFERYRQLLRGAGKKPQQTWREAIQWTCPITGENNMEIMRRLTAAGLSTHDMAHLEFLSNPAILAASGIQLKNETATTEEEKERDVANSKFKQFFGWPATYKEKYTEKVTRTYKYGINFQADVKNLILYLKAWVKILQADIPPVEVGELDKQNLHTRLLHAVADEDYEAAASLRNVIAQLPA